MSNKFWTSIRTRREAAAGLIALAAMVARPALSQPPPPATYDRGTVLDRAATFFGDASQGLAEALGRALDQFGEPTAYISGEEISGAIGAGARFGHGALRRKADDRADAETQVFWKGPSVGYDYGANVSKVFFLVYALDESEQIFRRFPGLQGNFYYAGGVSLDVHKRDAVTLVSVRAGVGAREGANISYIRFAKESSWLPF